MVKEYNKYVDKAYLENTRETLALKVTFVSGDSRIVTPFNQDETEGVFLYLEGPLRTIIVMTYESRRMKYASIRPGNSYPDIHPSNRIYLCPVAEMHINKDNIQSIEYEKVYMSLKGEIEVEGYDEFVKRMTPIYEQEQEEGE